MHSGYVRERAMYLLSILIRRIEYSEAQAGPRVATHTLLSSRVYTGGQNSAFSSKSSYPHWSAKHADSEPSDRNAGSPPGFRLVLEKRSSEGRRVWDQEIHIIRNDIFYPPGG